LDVFYEQNELSPAEKNRLQELKDNSIAFDNKRKLNFGKDQGKDTSETTCGL
jgi:hypothetical protein